jgi:glycosyltransferase involved in cell wall biosynthesis
MKLSVIIPVWNEASTIRQVVEAVRAVPLDTEIIVVDGQSTDGTLEILTQFEAEGGLRVIRQKVRNGRGGALRDGIREATGEVIVFQDGDLELDPACFPDLLEPITSNQADIVFGSRFLGGRPQMTFLQYWGNKAVNYVLNLLWGTHLTDVETCYQMFRREAVEGLTFDRTDMSFTVELTLRLIRTGRRIAEVPVGYTPRTAAEGKKLYWGDGFISLYVLFYYRLIWWWEDLMGQSQKVASRS